MAYGTLAADTIQSSTAGTPVQFNDGNGTQVGTLCRAWVSFNGTTSPGTIRGQFNVSSVTKTGTGSYTINFTNALSSANYACVATSGYGTSNSFDSVAPTTTAAAIGTYNTTTGAGQDRAWVGAGFFC